MQFLAMVRKVFDACLTALAVVFGLRPDPTASPVPVPVKHDRLDYHR